MISTRDFGALTTQNVVGRVLSLCPCHRQGELQQRRHRAGPPRHQRRRHAANDIIDSPFNIDPPGTVGLGWENDVRSNTADAGLFVTTDIAWDNGLDLTLGGRYDAYNVRSVDLGVLAFEPASGRGGKGSLHLFRQPQSYKTDWGLVPYVTNAKSSAIEIGQASQVLTSPAGGRRLAVQFLSQ